MGANDFAPYKNKYENFTIKNVCPDKRKTIFLWGVPVNFGNTRNLLTIPGISPENIKSSLQQGLLRHKLLAGDIVIVSSDIELILFNLEQKHFFQEGGVEQGLDAGSGSGPSTPQYLWREEKDLIGARDSSNRTFYTTEKFLNGAFTTGDQFHISIQHNGKLLYENTDYSIGESVPGLGYDMITFISIVPNINSILKCNYAVKA